MTNILHDSVQCPAEQLGVFVVHCDNDKELRLTRGVVRVLTEAEARERKVIGRRGDGGVARA